MAMPAHTPNPGLFPGLWSAEVSSGVELLEFSGDALWLLGRNPTTNIADNNLNCNVSFSAESIRFVKDVCLSL